MTLSEELAWRGFVNQTTFKDITALDNGSLTFYWGVDPSADSMQVGNLAIALMVRHFIKHGHKAVLLVGGATGLIGDPDGKAQERDLLPLETIANNKAAIAAQYQQVFSGLGFEVVDNYDWFKDMNYLDFLRNVGKHVPLRQMIGRDFVQSRLGEDGAGISYAEFSYSLIQGYDFLHLHREKDVTLQVCGADQWGNSIAGVELIRRITGDEAHVWSAPLVINKATGKKFGKSEAGAVWLDEKKTSVYQFYQFWLNVDDAGVEDYIKIYTLLSKEEVEAVLEDFKQNPGGRAAQKALAYEVTKIVHGEEKANAARRATEVLFGRGSFTDLTPTDIELLKAELPAISIDQTLPLPDVLVQSGLAASKSEANRTINGGGVSVNGTKVTGDNSGSLIVSGNNLVKYGKNKFAIIALS